ncbi:hypothetical protein GJR88_00640 [Dietzia sp. DQ12-45-1b]|nr:hypothetical protein GJR88_00640 [Dietzia sp. DQ12-45-1b]
MSAYRGRPPRHLRRLLSTPSIRRTGHHRSGQNQESPWRGTGRTLPRPVCGTPRCGRDGAHGACSGWPRAATGLCVWRRCWVWR